MMIMNYFLNDNNISNHSYQNDDNKLFFKNGNNMSNCSHQNDDNKLFLQNNNDISDYFFKIIITCQIIPLK